MDKDIANATTTDMDTKVSDFSVDAEVIDEAGDQKETTWINSDWSDNLGYYKSIPEFKEATRAIARWTVGLGFEASIRTENMLKLIRGWGEDSFQSILQNMIIVKKVNGDAYAEIIRDKKNKNVILNLKPLNPSNIRIVVDRKGIIIRYEEIKTKRVIAVENMFHLCNDRIANEIHGTSSLEAVKWVIKARNEAMSDWKRISHRSTIRVMYIDMEDKETLDKVMKQYESGIDTKNLLLLPGKKGQDIEFEDLKLPPINPFLEWIRYLEGFFYQALGVPKVIANSTDFTEAASKVGFLTFQPVYTEEQTLLEQDLFNQLKIKVKFNRPPSLSGVVQENEEKNTGQLGFQPTDTTATAGRVE